MKLSHAFTLKLACLSLLVVVIALAVVGASAPVAHAATITVSNANDSGTGSLRQTIADAAAGDTITFAGDYTIPLTSELTISQNLTIDGESHSVTVSGEYVTRVFYVNSGVTFHLNNLTVTKGRVTSAYGGGLFNSNGTVNVTNSAFSDNSATGGGGLCNFKAGTLNVTNSTFSGNSATSYGGQQLPLGLFQA